MYNIDSEKSLIALLINNPDLHLVIRDKLKTEEFCDSSNSPKTRKVYSQLLHSIDNYKNVDLTLIANNCNLSIDYINKFKNFNYEINNLNIYMDNIRSASVHRQVNNSSNELKSILDVNLTTNEMLESVDRIYDSIRKYGFTNDLDKAEVRNVVHDLMADMVREHNIPIEDRIILTPFTDLNKVIRGLFIPRYSIVAGRTSMGKSAIARQLIEKNKKHTAYFMLETSSKRYAELYIAGVTNVPVMNITDRTFMDDPIKKALVFNELNKMSELNLHIFNSEYREFNKFRNAVLQLKEKVDLNLVVSDFVQLMRINGYKGNRRNELARISVDISELAVKTNSHIMVTAQINRNCEARQNKRPNMSDIEDCGVLEQAADTVMLLYRDDYYNPDTERKGIMEVNVAKNRDGACKVVDLAWLSKKMRYGNLSKQDIRRVQEPVDIALGW